MKRTFDYIFIFLIGYQSYFLLSLLFGNPASQWVSVAVSLIGIALFVLVWLNKEPRFSRAQISMALTTGIMSFSSVALYALNNL